MLNFLGRFIGTVVIVLVLLFGVARGVILMSEPSDLKFFVGFLLNITCLWLVGYVIWMFVLRVFKVLHSAIVAFKEKVDDEVSHW